ncbi:hypothetical protein Taro_052020 [Colocasia esculenta]|uniref:Uncharacterized protein n=1 Tax=Colocasia esculenta TaxID=4460 RepID=A0A843XHI5_COLES|nr:hypothetical protein [Colocasia esculenta]
MGGDRKNRDLILGRGSGSRGRYIYYMVRLTDYAIIPTTVYLIFTIEVESHHPVAEEEARDKVAKIAGSQDPTVWMDYNPCHELERAPTFRELFDQTHKQKGTDDYVSESARTIAETYDRTMADCYVEGTPQPNLDPEA